MAARPARPQVRVGASLLIVGALVHGLAVFLPWFKYEGDTFTGRDNFLTKDGKILESPGSLWLFFGAVLLGLGIALYAAGRNLAVAIIAVVFASIALLVSFVGVGAASDMKDLANGGSVGFGAIFGILAALVALAGSITALAKRRR